MPSIAKFAYQLTTEEMYGFEAVAQITERIEKYNDSQLEGLRQHLQEAAAKAKSSLWKDANQSVLQESDPEWAARDEIKSLERKQAKEKATRAELEANFAAIDAANKIKLRNQIEAKCRKQATAEILEIELQSVVNQKVENKKYEWRRKRDACRIRYWAFFAAFLGVIFMAFLDPRVYYELGLILMMIFEFLMLFKK